MPSTQMLLGDGNEMWSEGPNHVRATSKQTEQELLASSPTMGPPISCNGYLAPAAAAKATSNGLRFRQDLLE